MEDDTGGEPPRIPFRHHLVLGCWSAAAAGLCFVAYRAAAAAPAAEAGAEGMAALPWHTILTPAILGISIVLAGLSAVFSASETAFFSLNKVQLRQMRASGSWSQRLVARLMERPADLLTTILMNNSMVNVLLSITFAAPMAEVFEHSLSLSRTQSDAVAVVTTTSILIFFCEILPKVFAARQFKSFALFLAPPIFLIDRVTSPLRVAVMALVGLLFRITRLSQMPLAPFLTDEEFKTLLSDGEASGVIEEDERQMIQGILEFSDATVWDILSPRPDIVAVKESATVGEALEVVREHEYARMPVYREDMDHIVGILYAKDLLAVQEQGELTDSVTRWMRRPHFVPQTMSVADFVNTAQRLRTHIAIVVDEYGGTEGLVTLQDALREVVGDIGDEDDVDKPLLVRLGDNRYRMGGNYPLSEFEEMMRIKTEDKEHTTIGGFLMALSDKIPEPGDALEYKNIRFKIEEVNEKRITLVYVEHAAPSAATDKT